MVDFAVAAAAGTEFLATIFERLEIKLHIEGFAVEDEEVVVLRMGGDVAHLAPNLLQALNTLTAQVMARAVDTRYVRCVIDPDGRYAQRRALLQLAAKDVARAVQVNGRRAVLDSLSAGERRVVHMVLADDANVNTRSEGDERMRLLLVEAAQ